jgi:class 3 adenylate cyclase
MVDRGDERIGDEDRSAVVDLLRSHTGAGRLGLDEFEELVGEVYAARTRAELARVLDGLPAGVAPSPSPPPPAPPLVPDRFAGSSGSGGSGGSSKSSKLGAFAASSAPAGRPAPASDSTGAFGAPAPPASGPVGGERLRRRFVAIMSGSNARGRWRVPRNVTAFAFWGGVHLDLRDSEFDSPVVDITAWAIMGGVNVGVPAGMRVELDGMVLMGGSTDVTRAAPTPPGSPLVRIHARGLWGGVTVFTAKPHRYRDRHRDHDHDRDRDRDRDRDQHADADGTATALDGLIAMPELVLPRLDDLIPPLPPPFERSRRRVEDLRQRDDVRRHGHGRWSDRYRSRGSDTDTNADMGTETGTVADEAANTAPGPSGTLTMMVTDVAGSTGLAERLGDRRWVDVLREHNTLVREHVARRGGTEVKAQGDGFLVVFSSARQAILAAVDVQRALVAYSDDHPDHPVTVRIGLHTGEIVDVDGDVFGQNVVVAVRIAGRAEPGEILVSGLTRDLTQAGGDLAFDPGEEVDLKGLSQPWRIHRVRWSPEEA